MPGILFPEIPHYIPANETKEPLDYADLHTIDLAGAQTPEGRRALVAQLQAAMQSHGFFYVVNHGLTSEQTKRMVDIADIPFSGVNDTEKKAYEADIKKTGSYQGYKLRQYWHIANGVRDQIEHYNIHRDITKKTHPSALRPLAPEIKAFIHHNHYNILHPLLRIFALGLELPEETLVNMHGFSAEGETFLRFMKYYPRSSEDEQKANNVWMKGHTDYGTITILWSQPVAALQILSKEGKWKWVKHVDNAIVINVGDAMEMLSGGYYHATIHRCAYSSSLLESAEMNITSSVVRPPLDQEQKTRLGVFYFGSTDNDIKLTPLLQSPVIQRLGINTRVQEGNEPPTMESYRKGRTAAYGQSETKALGNGVDGEVISGFLVKHYN